MVNNLPVSNIVNVQVILTALQAQAPAINSLVVVGSSPVIDITQRQRLYTSLTAVATDFGTTAPEYLAAQLWFGQAPQPTTLFIARWAQTATPAQLIGGPVSATNLLIATWNAITNGAFMIFIDGIPYAVTGLNFSAATNLNGVASIIQTGIRAATGGLQTVVYNATYNQFILTDGTTGTASTVGFANSPTAVGSAAFSGQPTANDTLVIGGTTITFVSGTPSGNQVQIGASLSATLTSLLTFLNASLDVNLVKANYFVVGSTLYIVFKTAGTSGNTFTLSKSSTAITLSGATLTGGSGTDISTNLTWTNATGNGAYLAQGLAAETALTAVTTLDSQFAGTSYGLIVLGAQDSDHQAIAAYVEGVAPRHYYGITTQEGGVIVPGDTADIAFVLKTLLYNHTAVQYSSQSLYAIASYLARILTTQWQGSLTTITLMFKQEPGVVPENLNSGQAAAAQAKNANVYTTYANGTQFIQYGTSCSGQFTDTVVGADWLAGQVQTNIFNTLFGATTKIPQTDPGDAQLIAAAQQACEQAVTNGYCAPGQWNGPGFGNLVAGAQLNTGFYIFMPPIATQSQAVRQTRAAPLMQIAIKNAGAIQSSAVTITVQQ